MTRYKETLPEAEVELQNASVETRTEPSLVRVFPLLVDNLERNSYGHRHGESAFLSVGRAQGEKERRV